MAVVAAAPLFTTALTGTVTAGGLASAVLTGYSLLQGFRGAQQQQYAYGAQAEGVKEQAHMERLKAQEEGNQRRERLLNALAAQNVRAGAGGVTGGTVKALQLKSMEDYERDQQQADLMEQSTQSGLRRQRESLKLQGQSAKQQGYQNMATSLLSIGYSPGATSSPSYRTDSNKIMQSWRPR